jgi:glucokinase
MNIHSDQRIVMTLDAGGTAFVFNAVRAGEELLEPHRLTAKGDSLEEILKRIQKGFTFIREALDEAPAAISFVFPGPADYRHGIIGDLENLPVFRGGVALKALLEDVFHIPVYINNDADLFAYGESMAGLLSHINSLLKQHDNPKQYRNLLGVTFGTGFGGGIVVGGQLFMGDNSAGGEINRMRNRLYPDSSAEDSVSIRGVQRIYAREAGISLEECPNPEEIYEIGVGNQEGNQQAARIAYEELAVVAGDTLANAVTLLDSCVVIGGGLSGAYPLFLQKLVDEMNISFQTVAGKSLNRMETTALNLENEKELINFLENKLIEITVPFTSRKVAYSTARYIGVGVTHLGTSKAVSIGSYAYALNQIDH